MKIKKYPEQASGDQKRTIRRLASGFFLRGEILYKRTPDLNLLRCVDTLEAEKIMNEVHSGVCEPHMNGYVLAKKILRVGYYWMTMEKNCFSFVRKCHQCQIHDDRIHAPPSELHPMSAPWPFVAWDNATNLNSHLMREVCEQFKITHRNSTPYRPKANGAVEVANKNIKKILKKMIQSSRQWHEKLPFALLGYHTTSVRIIVEAEIEDDEWIKGRLEKLTMIDEKRMTAVCHGQLYQQRMARAYNKKVRPRKFKVGQLVLRHILPHHEEAKGKFAPNWKGPYIIRKLLPKGALYLGDIEGNDREIAVNADAVKSGVYPDRIREKPEEDPEEESEFDDDGEEFEEDLEEEPEKEKEIGNDSGDGY
ncbi:uncharacterized protein [Nicotiana tomentosiformis]|uniref:uncharacterized protein n=1 Tax=Nicotiana tomentosiformis TaxID=4098 RepID=UPI00388CDB97